MRFSALFSLALAATISSDGRAADPAAGPLPERRMVFLENDALKLGVDLNLGGAITFLARKGGENVVNNFDLGRQIQMSFYAGPVPFSAGDKHPAKQWAHLGWNPVQTGDDFNHGSKVLDHRVEGSRLYIKCAPMQWPLNNVPGDCTFESWLELDGPILKARARINNARTDHTRYGARQQEMPALYANAAFPRVVSYTGDTPFTGAPIEEIPKAKGPHPWSFWRATEGWSALLDAKDSGIGLIAPGRVQFTGGFVGRPGPNDSTASSTGYLASLAEEILDHDIVYEYRYEVLVGSLAEIRARAAAVRSKNPPAWTFTSDRQSWQFRNALDTGWPIVGALNVPLEKPDPQLVSPYFFLRTEDAPTLVIDAAFHTRDKTATIYWQRDGEHAPGAKDFATFPIQPDGQFHRYTVRLSENEAYRGSIVRLRFDPSADGAPGDWVKVKSIAFTR